MTNNDYVYRKCFSQYDKTFKYMHVENPNGVIAIVQSRKRRSKRKRRVRNSETNLEMSTN